MRAVALVGVAVCAASGLARAQDSAPRSEALQVLNVLQEAQAARTQRVELQRGAQAESARLAAQLAEAKARAELANTRARRTRERIASLQAEAGPLDEREAQLTALMDGVAQRVHDALDAMSERLLPDLIPPATKPTPTRSEDRFEAALERLDQAERRLSQVEATIIETQLDGETVAVEVLRFGGAAAWWRTLDGERFGTVRVESGRVQLTAQSGPGLADRVETAFAVAKGRAAPELLSLPLVPLSGDLVGEEGPSS